MDYITLFLLFSLGLVSFLLSTITGGGGAMTLLPIMNIWLGPNATAPILT